MYERFFNLRERPFALSPDPDYLYPSRVHREALSYLRYGIESQAGFVVITGEIGSGKTTLLQALLRGLDGQTTVIRLMNTLLDPRELLEAITIDLGLDPGTGSKPVMLRDLATRLVDERTAGRLVLLVIDEAQNLSLPALEEIRMLSNLETEKSKLIQIVLVGQPDLRDKLEMPALEQLRQRITVSYHLAALDAAETEAYVNHRLRRAALGAPLLFPRDVTDRIHERSRGVPRLVNVVCDAVLVFAYAEEHRAIDRSVLDEALRELEATGVLRAPAEASAAQAVPQTDGRVRSAAPATAADSVAQAEGRAVASAAPGADRPLAAVEEATAVRQADADVALTREVEARAASLRAREEELYRRERRLAEQQKVLAEEYRLFRARPSQAPPRAAGPARPEDGPPAWPPAGTTAAAASAGTRSRPATAADGGAARVASFRARPWEPPPSPRRRFWRRVKEVLLGVPEPVMEDRP